MIVTQNDEQQQQDGRNNAAAVLYYVAQANEGAIVPEVTAVSSLRRELDDRVKTGQEHQMKNLMNELFRACETNQWMKITAAQEGYKG
eukprot:scaffold5529_cov117-Cylindrotheca_fusiformis.AAC.15